MCMKTKLLLFLTLVLFAFTTFAQTWYDACDVFVVANQDTITERDTIIFYGAADTVIHYTTDRPAFTYHWSGQGLNRTQRTATVSVPLGGSRTDTIDVSYKNPANTVRNGDFEMGNNFFTSGLEYAANPGTVVYTGGVLWGEGKYSIGTNPKHCHANWVNNTHDGNMFIANGSGTPNTVVYQTDIGVQPYTDYAVSFEAANIDDNANNGNIARFQFAIDNTPVGDIFNISTNIFQWGEYYQIWNSGDAVVSTITILNQNTALSGNDFAIDNIEVHELCYVRRLITVQNRIFVDDIVYDTICEGDAFVFRGVEYYETTDLIDTIYAAGDLCVDTIVQLHLVVNPKYESTTEAEICKGESYMFNGHTYSMTGYYTEDLQTINGCDSILHLDLKVNPIYDTTVVEGICDGESYTSNGFNESTSGIYTAVIPTVDGCDSVVHLNLTVFPNFDLYYKEQIDEGMIYTNNGFEESESGIYVHEGTSVHGCDSITTLELFVKKEPIIYTPNVFTPTKDNNNTFRVIYGDDETKLYSFEIYDRWGTKVFETDDIEQAWDGKYNGSYAPQGVYVYFLKFYGNDKILRERKGEVMLLY